MNRAYRIPLALAALLVPFLAQAEPVNDAALMAETPPKLLSEYRLFTDGKKQTPNDRVFAYHLNTPLFSDYAAKYRFVYVPEGKKAQYRENDVFAFPVGTALVKTFAYPADMQRPDENIRILETRLLIHQADGWIGLPYVWNDDMTEATLKKAGKRIRVAWSDESGKERTTTYRVPNVNQCKGCHVSHKKMIPIGPKARNLNMAYEDPNGPDSQLDHWVEIGVLDHAPEDAPAVPVWEDPSTGSLEDRARAYLDVNCGHCHTPGGPGDTSGLFLTYTERNPTHLGIEKRPVAAGRGSGGFEFDIAPGQPDQSILIFRMKSLDPGIAMPELGRTMVHDEGVDLIREWIENMEGPTH